MHENLLLDPPLDDFASCSSRQTVVNFLQSDNSSQIAFIFFLEQGIDRFELIFVQLQVFLPFGTFLQYFSQLRFDVIFGNFLAKILNLILHLKHLKAIIIRNILIFILLKFFLNSSQFLPHISLLHAPRYILHFLSIQLHGQKHGQFLHDQSQFAHFIFCQFYFRELVFGEQIATVGLQNCLPEGIRFGLGLGYEGVQLFQFAHFWVFNQCFYDNIRGDMLNNKMRLTFFELKIEESEKKGRELRRSQGKKAAARGRVLSMAYDKHSKTKTAPEDPERKRVGFNNPQQYTQPTQPNRNINKIMFTLPQIKPIITQQQTEPQDLVSYHSTKLTTPINNHKMMKNSKDFSSRYYRQIQIMKEMREPSSSQKIFTITHLQNKELDGVGKNIQKKLGKKGMPSAALDKYQIVRDRQEIAVPSELLAKKFTSCAFEDENSGKNTTRFRFDSMVKLNKRSKSNLTPGGEQVFKLEGWGREDEGMQFYRYQ